jgi:hypothetical protein
VKNFLHIAGNTAVMPLLLALSRAEKSNGIWQADTYLRDYAQGPFKDTESVILRFPPRSVHETEEALKQHEAGFDQHENVDQPAFALLSEARPLVFDLMAYVRGERLGRVMINKLRPGGVIFPHADTPVHAEYWDRFHICLQSSPGSNFRCGDETVFMRQGEVWWFNNRIEHEVINHSGDDRIHMIVDIRTSKPC